MKNDNLESWLRPWFESHMTKGDDDALKESIEEVGSAVFRYGFPKFLLEETVIQTHGKADSAQQKKDARKISKLASELAELLELTHAGQHIRNLGNGVCTAKHLLAVAALADKYANNCRPKDGRKHTDEVAARRNLVASLKRACERVGVYAGSGETGVFPDFVRSVFSHCGIELDTVSNDTRAANSKA